MDLETWERDQNDARDSIMNLAANRARGAPFETPEAVRNMSIKYTGRDVYIVPFEIISREVTRGNITDMQYVPGAQSVIAKYKQFGQSLTHNRFEFMLLYVHRNGKMYFSRTLYDATTRQIHPPSELGHL